MRTVLLYSFLFAISCSFICVPVLPDQKTYAFMSLVHACEHSGDINLAKRARLTRNEISKLIVDADNHALQRGVPLDSSLLGILDYKKLKNLQSYDDISSLETYVLPKTQGLLQKVHESIALKLSKNIDNDSRKKLVGWQSAVIQMHLLIDQIQSCNGRVTSDLVGFDINQSRKDRKNTITKKEVARKMKTCKEMYEVSTHSKSIPTVRSTFQPRGSGVTAYSPKKNRDKRI